MSSKCFMLTLSSKCPVGFVVVFFKPCARAQVPVPMGTVCKQSDSPGELGNSTNHGFDPEKVRPWKYGARAGNVRTRDDEQTVRQAGDFPVATCFAHFK